MELLFWQKKKQLEHNLREDLDVWIEGKFESVSIEVDFNAHNGGKMARKITMFTVVYKPPTASFDDSSNGFEYLLPKVKKSGNEFVCMGDFNYNLLNASGDSLEFLNLRFADDLYPVVTLPTRLTEKSAVLIDNFFVSSKRINSTYADVLLTPVSDHFPVLTKFQLECSTTEEEKPSVYPRTGK
ncbi:hypothetical protein QYM36_018203 [Artemia franciscana]|uniref:Endonuclease/exonuclease/phosphatase domain-containing protein n=1 Tax=Artemia franciscana TaxID=6661 RepID=A0AA88KV02_ARTSF|nr:hypothetical protein QYM36_018203 [Artemia franciscana]